MTRLIHIKSKKTLPTYSRLRAVSWYALKLANDGKTGWLHHCMTAMLFSAFCLEAYLNHLGDSKIPFWEPLKKKLSPLEKLQVLSTSLNFVPDLGARPYQTFKSIFKLRDLLVHAKTEVLISEGDFILSPNEMPPEPLSEWEQLLSIQGARRFVEDTKAMIINLGSHAGVEQSAAFEEETVEWIVTNLHDDATPSS